MHVRLQKEGLRLPDAVIAARQACHSCNKLEPRVNRLLTVESMALINYNKPVGRSGGRALLSQDSGRARRSSGCGPSRAVFHPAQRGAAGILRPGVSDFTELLAFSILCGTRCPGTPAGARSLHTSKRQQRRGCPSIMCLCVSSFLASHTVTVAPALVETAIHRPTASRCGRREQGCQATNTASSSQSAHMFGASCSL